MGILFHVGFSAKGKYWFLLYNSHIPEVKPTREHGVWTGVKSIDWTSKISSYDAVIISTNHSSINYRELAEWSECLIDTRNALKEIEPENDIHIWKA